ERARDGERLRVAEAEARRETTELVADRERGGREHPGGLRSRRERREPGRDVERQQAQRETALGELHAARPLVVLGMHDGVETAGELRGARRALRDAQAPPL